jgi:hypothetical protein
MMKIGCACAALAGLVGIATTRLAAQANPAALTASAPTPTKVKLDWPPSTGAKGYWVQRAAGNGSGNFSVINAEKLAMSWYVDLGAQAATTFRYRVKAVYDNSPPTFSPVATVTTPSGPVNTASSGSASQPTVPANPAAVPSNPVATPAVGVPMVATLELAPVTLAPVTLAPVTMTAAAPAPQNLAPPAPAPAPVVSGRYRVVANGFSVIHESSDDILSRDGKYDEVYGAFMAFHFDRASGNLLDRDLRRTKVLGDIAGFPDRLRAGTGNGPDGSGGLRGGDSYPDAGHARSRSAPPNNQTFPFAIWEGTLTNGADAAVILPTMWEQDNSSASFDSWSQAETGSASQIWWDAAVQRSVQQSTFGVIAPPGSTTPWMGPTVSPDPATQGGQAVATAFLIGMGQPWVAALFLGSSDRPIGMIDDGVSPKMPRRAIVLTREIIELALNSPKVPMDPASGAEFPWLPAYLDVPVGVIPVLLMDREPFNKLDAAYVLYLQVERM